MISYIKGTLSAIERDRVIVDVHGIGWGIFMPEQTMAQLPQTGNEVQIYTYLNVKEDAMQLYGFLTRDDLEIFKLLIKVSGIGPKGGLSILSGMSADDLRFAVLSGDAKAISAAPGIGKKTAEKVIIELKDKLDLDDFLQNTSDAASVSGTSGTGIDSGIQSEAVQALVALGYGSTESLRAVKQTSPECTTVEDVLKEALKLML